MARSSGHLGGGNSGVEPERHPRVPQVVRSTSKGRFDPRRRQAKTASLPHTSQYAEEPTGPPLDVRKRRPPAPTPYVSMCARSTATSSVRRRRHSPQAWQAPSRSAPDAPLVRRMFEWRPWLRHVRSLASSSAKGILITKGIYGDNPGSPGSRDHSAGPGRRRPSRDPDGRFVAVGDGPKGSERLLPGADPDTPTRSGSSTGTSSCFPPHRRG